MQPCVFKKYCPQRAEYAVSVNDENDREHDGDAACARPGFLKKNKVDRNIKKMIVLF